MLHDDRNEVVGAIVLLNRKFERACIRRSADRDLDRILREEVVYFGCDGLLALRLPEYEDSRWRDPRRERDILHRGPKGLEVREVRRALERLHEHGKARG